MKSILRLSFVLTLLLCSQLIFAKDIIVEDPYVRAIPPGQTISAAFLVLKNNSNHTIDLIKASSDSAKHVELHEHVHEAGMMKMRQVAKISVAANSTTELKPGGYHIMLIDLVKNIQPKDKILLHLAFSDGSKQQVVAEVKKIMIGMMKNKMSIKQGMAFKLHVNPMPNLMAVFKKMGDQLDLTAQQKNQLKTGIKKRNPKITALYKTVKKLEQALHQATLDNASLGKIDQLADKLMQTRFEIIHSKMACRESIKKILDKKQFQKMVALYHEKMMPKTKISIMKHTNPLPNLMRVVMKSGDALQLSKQQAIDLKKWRTERQPVIKKVAKTIVQLEAQLLEAGLNNEPFHKIEQLGDAIMQNRVKIIRGKVFAREHIKRVLDDKQYAKVIELYKSKSL